MEIRWIRVTKDQPFRFSYKYSHNTLEAWKVVIHDMKPKKWQNICNIYHIKVICMLGVMCFYSDIHTSVTFFSVYTLCGLDHYVSQPFHYTLCHAWEVYTGFIQHELEGREVTRDITLRHETEG